MKLRILGFAIIALFTFNSCEEMALENESALVPPTVLEDDALPSININGLLLHSETFGDPADPMVVVIHGGPGADYKSLLNYKQLVSDSLFVVFYDQRGSGLSERIDKSQYSNVQLYIDELDAVINYYRQSNTQKIILAGHSWGGMLAAAYINQNPTVVSAAILTEPGGFTWEQTIAYIERSRKLKLFDELTNDFVYQDQFITGSDHNTLDYKLALSTAGNVNTGDLLPLPFWRYGAICNIASIELARDNPEQLDFTTNLLDYNTKVLFAYSELNTAYGLAHAELVSAALPNVQLVQIIGSGHEMPQFGWNELYPTIKTYLNEIL